MKFYVWYFYIHFLEILRLVFLHKFVDTFRFCFLWDRIDALAV